MTDMMIRLLAVSVLAAVALAGCKSSPDAATLQTENESVRAQLDQANRALEAAERERQAAEARASESQAKDDTASRDFEGIEGVSAVRVGNEVHVTIEGDVLFDSGRASLKDAAKKSLDKVAGVLKDTYSGKYIRVAGFTDTDPIKRSGFKSNYHLGFDRAFSVGAEPVGKKLDGKSISLSSFGPDVPLTTKALSRRVEVIVVD